MSYVRNTCAVCDRCKKAISNRNEYFTLKTLRTEKSNEYYTKEVVAKKNMHLCNDCYKIIFSFMEDV